MTTTMRFDAEALRRSVEERDSEAMLGLYAEDAELTFVDRRDQPSKPMMIHGREAIGEFFDDICGRDMSHHVDRVVVGDDSAAYLETCVYPDGTRVLSASVLDLDHGLITKHTGVQAWDE
jgi:ketosteroid isomerase-like protein